MPDLGTLVVVRWLALPVEPSPVQHLMHRDRRMPTRRKKPMPGRARRVMRK